MKKPRILVTSAGGHTGTPAPPLAVGATAIMMNNEIKAHYASPGLYERIVQGLEAIGKSPASVDLSDLSALDELHLRGPAATRELIEILGVGADSHVLDVGSGLGGPARRLAKATGCRVTGVDLSEDYRPGTHRHLHSQKLKGEQS